MTNINFLSTNYYKIHITHLPLDKKAAISQTKFQMHIFKKRFCILIQIWLKFAPKGAIDNNPALVQIMDNEASHG